jgi:hypothetical protein
MEVYMLGAELSWDQIEATQNAANKQTGPRFVPGRSIPVPSTVSPSLETTIAAPYRTPAWDVDPKDAADWKTLISTLGDETAAATRDMREKLGVTMEPTVIDGVKAFILTPKVIAPENQNRLLVNVHGGGFVYNPGVAGTEEPTSMAAYGGFKPADPRSVDATYLSPQCGTVAAEHGGASILTPSRATAGSRMRLVVASSVSSTYARHISPFIAGGLIACWRIRS